MGEEKIIRVRDESAWIERELLSRMSEHCLETFTRCIWMEGKLWECRKKVGEAQALHWSPFW